MIAQGYIKEDGKKKLRIVGGSVEGSTVTDYDAQHTDGSISSSEYVEKMGNPSFGYKDSPKWSITGMGNGQGFLGIGSDHFTIHIGTTKKSYSLSTGDKVEDKTVIEALNVLATGSKDETPSTSYESAINAAENIDSGNKPGKIVVYEGKMYVYTKKGWRSVKDRKNKVADAVAAFIKESNK